MTLALSTAESWPQVDVLGRWLNRPVEPVFAPADSIGAMINDAYQQRSGQAEEFIAKLDRREVLEQVRQVGRREDLLDSGGRAPVIQLVNLVLFEAVQGGASDVHIQPTEDELVVRLRIDGVLFDAYRLPKDLQDEVTSRIKVLGRMNIAEKLVAQDGRATVRVGDRLIDLRIASLPTSHGERVVVRLLDKSARLYRLDELGMSPHNLALFRQLISREHGLILVTDPTGSGKSTTLYAALQEINNRERNILTLEDPIEYELEGVSQTQVTDRKGMTFASGLRSVLRQDPDIIMLGEIRDRETAVMAIQSSLTGHLVFSTLHTNDAPSAVTRLLDLGVEPYLVASSVIGVLAQRLVRQVCRHCAEPAELTPLELSQLGLEANDSSTANIRRGKGCEICRQTGYRGRIAIGELLPMTDAIRELVQRQANASDIRQCAIGEEMKSLRDDGVRKILLGVTTVEESLRVVNI